MATNPTKIIIPKYKKLGYGYKPRDMAREAPGRQTNPKKGYQLPGAFLDDLAGMKQAIILCSFCQVKWGNPRKQGYRARFIPDPSGLTSGYAVQGKCDACKEMTGNMGGGKVFISVSTWDKVSQDPVLARRRARQAWGQRTARQRVAEVQKDARNNPHKYRPEKIQFAVTDNRKVK